MPDSATLTPRDARRRLERLIDDQVAERSDAMYIRGRDTIEQLGRIAAEPDVFGDNQSQMNKLERMALSASTFGAIADYVKSQMGRDTNTGEAWRNRRFGRRLLDNLEEHAQSVSEDTEALLNALDDPLVQALQDREDDVEAARERLQKRIARRLRLGYAQAFVGHVVAQYSYKVSVG
jgi:hypothetical protein